MLEKIMNRIDYKHEPEYSALTVECHILLEATRNTALLGHHKEAARNAAQLSECALRLSERLSGKPALPMPVKAEVEA